MGVGNRLDGSRTNNRRGRDAGAWYDARIGRDRRDETVPAPVRGLYVGWRPRIVLQRAADLADADFQGAVADVHIGPGQIQQLVFGDELTGAIDEVLKNGEGLGRQGHDGVAAAELSSGGIEPEWTKHRAAS